MLINVAGSKLSYSCPLNQCVTGVFGRWILRNDVYLGFQIDVLHAGLARESIAYLWFACV